MQIQLVYDMPNDSENYANAINGLLYRKALQSLIKKLKDDQKSGARVSYTVAQFKQMVEDAVKAQNVPL